ncbi:two-component sensor histidine kinase, partial [Pelomonas sp. HMWF004]
AEVQKIGGRVRRSAVIMARLVNDLIGYTRTELGSGMPFVPQPLQLQVVCQAALDDAQATHPATRFELVAEGDLDGVFDGTRLHQLFTNLLVNAAKYGAANEPVRVGMSGQADTLRVDVNNRGSVIPESECRSIFQPLVRLSNSVDDNRPEEETSLGLGLYVAREIASLHGGTIEVRSTAEAGTTFTVWLPRAPVLPPAPAPRTA